MFGGRELERITFDTAIGFAAVIDSDRVRPADRYRGVVRDREYSILEHALRAGLVRAIEAHTWIAAGGACPRGIDVGSDISKPDLVWVREAYRLARELGVKVRPPLSSVPLWPDAAGRTVSLEELRDKPAIGVAPLGSAGRRLGTRPVILVDDRDRAELMRLLPQTVAIVRYEPHHLAYESDPGELARGLLARHPHALAIATEQLTCAIAPAALGESRLVLRHRGARITEQAYQPQLVPCAIVLESDAIIPGEGWTSLAGVGGVVELDLPALEHALIRAAAHALVGERPSTLFGAAAVDLAEGLGRTLCQAILATDPHRLLGDVLIAKLRTQPLLAVLGSARLHSMDEVALMFTESIPYVETFSEPSADFTPVVAPGEVMRAVAALTARQARNATVELEDRRAAFTRDLRLARHRETSPRTLALPAGATGIEIETTIARGVVGVGRDLLEIHVHVEGRPFQVITRPGEPPLHALVDVAIGHTLPTFEAMRPQSADDLVTAIRNVTPVLLVAIAEAHPTRLADAGTERELAIAWVAAHELSRNKRDKLRDSIAFPTVQGSRTALGSASAAGALSVASWTGTWLSPEGNDEVDDCDRPIVHVPDGASQVRTLLEAIYEGTITDVTPAVAALQARRQMARGLLPKPRVSAPPELTRPLDAFGDAGSELGIGEVALVPGPSLALVHVHGELRARIPIDVLPYVHVALEAPELLSPSSSKPAMDLIEDPIAQLQLLAADRPHRGVLAAQIQRIAIPLAHLIMSAIPHGSLPTEIRHSLRRAIFENRFDGRTVTVPVFETVTGAWVAFAQLAEQRRQFHQIWAVPRGTRTTLPLDEQRIVLVLEPDELSRAIASDLAVIDGTRSLELDAETRINRARPRATDLELDRRDLLAEIALDGDGISAPRGRVGVLAPRRADRRLMSLHRQMHPFDALPDPCDWPTVTVLDDARLQPIARRQDRSRFSRTSRSSPRSVRRVRPRSAR